MGYVRLHYFEFLTVELRITVLYFSFRPEKRGRFVTKVPGQGGNVLKKCHTRNATHQGCTVQKGWNLKGHSYENVCEIIALNDRLDLN
jgi:hypothetical protein